VLKRSRIALRHQDKHGGSRGSDGQKRLSYAGDQIDFVAHVNAPSSELIEQFNLKTNTEPRIRHRLVKYLSCRDCSSRHSCAALFTQPASQAANPTP
jgi:hypothetical protein